MKVGTDGTLLGAWAEVPAAAVAPRVLDIGTGTGLIALMMAQRFPRARVVGVDIDPEAALQARENAAASPFADRVDIIEGDITALTRARERAEGGANALGRGTFDAIVCNPPFFTGSLHSPDAQRSLARHADTLTYRELMDSAWRLLDDGGELSVVIPSDCRDRLGAEAVLAGFFKARQCAVKTTPAKPPRRFLMAFRKHPTTAGAADSLERELVVGSQACNELTKDFYL